MNNSELFLDKYKLLEQTISKKYKMNKNDSPINFILNNKAYSSYKQELNYCREVRNFLSHEPKIDKEFAIIPSDEMIELIDKLIKLVDTAPLCYKVCKKINEIYYKKLSDNVLKSLSQLSHKLYTHIPIIDNDLVVGVFSKDSLFNYLVDNDFKKIDEKITFKDIYKYINLDSQNGECYVFVKKDITIDEVIILVEEKLSKGKRISYVFLTLDGTKESKVYGLITPWDLLGY